MCIIGILAENTCIKGNYLIIHQIIFRHSVIITLILCYYSSEKVYDTYGEIRCISLGHGKIEWESDG